jgi:hypothetical protein
MYAIKGIYDGQFADPVPVKEKYDVLITFLKPIDLSVQPEIKSEEKLAALNRLVGITANNPVTFDYTKWRKDNLFTGMSVEDISQAAMKLWQENKLE